MTQDTQGEAKFLRHLLEQEREHTQRLRALLEEERIDLAESRQEFLDRVDGNDSRYEQALFSAIAHLLLIENGIGDPVRVAENCLESIDARLGQQR